MLDPLTPAVTLVIFPKKVAVSVLPLYLAVLTVANKLGGTAKEVLSPNVGSEVSSNTVNLKSLVRFTTFALANVFVFPCTDNPHQNKPAEFCISTKSPT